MFHKATFAIWFFLALCSAQITAAHPDGHQSISDERAIQIASATAADLTERDAGLDFGQLDSSWKGLPAEAVKVHVKRSGYYIVSLSNEAQKKTLYVLISNLGDVYDANFTGDFPGLEE